MIPPRSPYSLIQEDLWPNDWLILVACIMLNCTRRKQVEKVLPAFVERWATPAAFMAAPLEDVVALCKPLGFANRRSANLKKMTKRYLMGPWEHARELPGIGEYGARSWEIFCCGILGAEPPKDHALVQYYEWRSASLRDDAVVLKHWDRHAAVDEERHVGRSHVDPGSDADQVPIVVESAAA